jgi:hypothetical protein
MRIPESARGMKEKIKDERKKNLIPLYHYTVSLSTVDCKRLKDEG